MEKLKLELKDVNASISDLEIQIEDARKEAESNIKPLESELAQIKNDKRHYGAKSDFESVQDCIRRENNLKFRISAQWNRCALLKEDLSILKSKRSSLESKIKLEEDKIRRNEEIVAKMDIVLANYRKSQNLKKAAIDSNISPNSVHQWYEWGKNEFNETYSYFYHKIAEIDDYFRRLEADNLKKQMDDVIEAYKKTYSLKKAAEIAHVSYDTVQYWHEWGSRGFGSENAYFYKRISGLDRH